MQKIVKERIIITPKRVNKNQFKIAKKRFLQSFDLINTRLFRVEMYIVENETYLLMDFSHLIFDGISINNLVNKISFYYNSGKINKEEYNMGQWILLENDMKKTIEYTKNKAFFDNMFENDFSKIDIKHSNIKKKNKRRIYRQKFNYHIGKKVNDFVKQNKITQSNVFLSAYVFSLSKLSYSNDIIIGTTFNGRTNRNQFDLLGCYIKNIPLRVNINKEDNILTYINKVQNITDKAVHNSLYSHEELKRTLKLKRNIENNSLFNMMYIYQNLSTDIKGLMLGEKKIKINEIPNSTPKMDIILNVYPEKNTFRFEIEYNEKHYDKNFIEEFYRIFKNTVEYFTTYDNKLTDIDILTKEQLEKLKKIGSKTSPHYKTNIINLIEEQYKLIPDEIAIITNKKHTSYGELWRESNKVANYLMRTGVNIGNRIAVEMNRTNELIIAIIGILKAGASYVPIDKYWPKERKRNVFLNGKIDYILIDNDRVNGIYNRKLKGLNINTILKDKTNSTKYKRLNISSESLAYTMFTSGTTGVPKAVMIKHDSIVNFVESINSFFDYSMNKNILSVTTIAFDIFVFELFPTLCLGNTLCLANDEQTQDPKKLLNFIKANNVNKILTTPSRISLLLDCLEDEKLKNITDMYIGGEPFNRELLYKLNNRVPFINIYNCYGPTETTVYSTFKKLSRSNDITVGKPINNTHIYIIDKYERITIPGIIGQICIGGTGRFKGYYNNQALTNASLIKLKNNKGFLYKTGDIGFWNNDGELICLGRNDNQVKVRGYRIELDEINEVSNSYKGIKNSVTIIKKIDDKNVLSLYYVKNKNFILENFIKYLELKLPKYMIPQHIIELDRIPLNSNGKINKSELINYKEKDIEKEHNGDFSVTELQMLSVLKTVLKTDYLSKKTDLFKVGLDSLSAMQVVLEASNKNINIEYADIFEYPTIEKLSKKIELNSSENKLTSLINKLDYSKIDKTLYDRNKIETYDNNINILIFGVTGFLGMHVLSKFIDNYSGRIYCIIREKDNTNGIKRFKNRLKYYFNNRYNNLIGKRIVIINGDMTDKSIFDNQKEVMSDIDLIINAAALVKHFGNIDDFKQINYNAVLNIIDLCKKYNKKLIHISTTSVSGDFLNRGNYTDKKIYYDETNLYIKQSVENNYIYTKFMAEFNILNEIALGKLNATIMRMGNLMGRSTDGKFQFNYDENAFMMRIKSINTLGVIPKNIINKYIEFTPIDYAAEAILKLMFNYKNSKVFHIFNNNYIMVKDVIETMEKDIQVISEKEFYNYLIDFSKDNINKGYIYEMLSDIKKNR